MRLSIVVVVSYLFFLGCVEKNNDREDKLTTAYLKGSFSLGDSTVDEFLLWGCFCHVLDSGFRIVNTSGNGLTGQELTAFVGRKDTTLSFDTWTCVGGPQSYLIESYIVNLDHLQFDLGDSLTGKIQTTGTYNHDGKNATFKIAGRFKCKLKDGSYTYESYIDELLHLSDSIKMLSLRQTANNRPDTIFDLTLEYENFYLIEDELGRFTNLARLSLSKFPVIEDDLILNFPQLKELQIRSDQLSHLPENIGDLKDLEILNVSAPIVEVPKGLYTLKNLRELDLGATQILDVSTSIKNLRKLEKLNLCCVDVLTIPYEIFELSNLVELSLPEKFAPFKINGANLTSLKTLFVPYDFLLYNKESIGKLSDLEWLYPSIEYLTHDEHMMKYGDQMRWLESQLPCVGISSITTVLE